jgi:two-component system NarL family sensor kinase
MSLKLKLNLLFVSTLLLALCVVGLQLVRQSAELERRQRDIIESSMLGQKQVELVRAVAFLKTELAAAMPAAAPADPERAKAIIGAATDGVDGYFFAYDREGRCLVHPRQPELVGQDLQSLVDDRGRHVIPALIETARAGGGFQRYAWNKPSTGRATEKLGYVSLLEPWGWTVGTGVYLDDVEAATRSAQVSSQQAVRRTLGQLGLIALVAVLAVFSGGLLLTVSEQRLADRKLRALTDRIVHLQEEERARVARDLHDGIVQVIASAHFLIGAGEQRLEPEQAVTRELLGKAKARLDEAVDDVRRIAHGLRPATLDELGLSSALRELLDETAQRSGLRVELLDATGGRALGAAESVALLRVAQEALTNVERYAGATQVSVELTVDAADRVTLRVRDDGRGFDTRARSSGSGLGNMRRRIEELTGSFRVESRPGSTELSAVLRISS